MSRWAIWIKMMEAHKSEDQGNDASQGSLGAKLVRLSIPFGIVFVAVLIYAVLAREPEETKRPPAPPRAI